METCVYQGQKSSKGILDQVKIFLLLAKIGLNNREEGPVYRWYQRKIALDRTKEARKSLFKTTALGERD